MVAMYLPLLLAWVGQAAANVGDATFAAPVRLRAGGEPMGQAQLFPSPVLFDLDRDGTLEMVVGDLVGNLMVSRRVPGEDRLAWTAGEALRGADGQPLKFHNW